jgi:hypothetical protein
MNVQLQKVVAAAWARRSPQLWPVNSAREELQRANEHWVRPETSETIEMPQSGKNWLPQVPDFRAF